MCAVGGRAITLARVASASASSGHRLRALLMSGVARDLARDRIRPDIDRILASWS